MLILSPFHNVIEEVVDVINITLLCVAFIYFDALELMNTLLSVLYHYLTSICIYVCVYS